MDLGTKERPSPIKNNPALVDAYQVHNELSKTIDEMDVKIDEVIKQHEAQFLLAYRNHIKNMKEELALIKGRAEEQQKKMLSNDRAVYLEKQVILFREQALKLYDKLEQKTEESEFFKSQAKEIQKAKTILQKQNKELLRLNKSLEAEISIKDSNISDLQQKLKETNNSHQRNPTSLRRFSKGQTTKTLQQTQNIDIFSSKQKDSSNHPGLSVNSRKYAKSTSIKPQPQILTQKLSILKSKNKHTQLADYELKNWFLECIQTIRKQVAQRKVYGYKTQDFRNISSWNQFRMIDKLRLLQMFMQNEKLLVWLYEKIFPTRISELQQYFKAKKENPFENGEKSKSVNINAPELLESLRFEGQQPLILDETINESSLPKVIATSQKKSIKKKYDIRQRIDIKNGKLNFSALNYDI